MATSHVERIEEAARSEGALNAKRETLIRLLTLKFGALSDELRPEVQGIASETALDNFLDRVLEANTPTEMGLPE